MRIFGIGGVGGEIFTGSQSIAAKLPVGERERVTLNVLLGRANHDPIAHQAQSGATYERDLLEYRKTWGVAGIRIEPSPNEPCANAKGYAGCYKLEDAPDYPFGPCEMTGPEYEGFCTCGWSAVFDDEKPKGGWKVPKKRHPLAGAHIETPPEPMTEDGIRSLAAALNNITDANIIQIGIANSKRRGEFARSKSALSYRMGRICGRLLRLLFGRTR
jgi:hypothetical protein